MRSRSKWISHNITEYLTQCPGLTHCPWPITEIFTRANYDKLFISNKILLDNNDLIVSNIPVDHIEDEIEHRFALLDASNKNMCIKIHPTGSREHIMINRIKEISDYYITLCRRNLLEQCLSAALSLIIDSWESNNKQKQIIEDTCFNPITIDIEFWKNIITKLQDQRNYILKENSNKLIYMEDTLSIKDTKDFCKLLGLPHKDFNFHQRFDIEFGNFKKDMIYNYDELIYIFNKIIAS